MAKKENYEKILIDFPSHIMSSKFCLTVEAKIIILSDVALNVENIFHTIYNINREGRRT